VNCRRDQSATAFADNERCKRAVAQCARLHHLRCLAERPSRSDLGGARSARAAIEGRPSPRRMNEPVLRDCPGVAFTLNGRSLLHLLDSYFIRHRRIMPPCSTLWAHSSLPDSPPPLELPPLCCAGIPRSSAPSSQPPATGGCVGISTSLHHCGFCPPDATTPAPGACRQRSTRN
jgi:hypothetical protein